MKDTDSSIETDRIMSGRYDGITDTSKSFRRLRDDHFSFRGWATTAAGQWNLCNCLYNFYLYCISGYADDSLYPYIKFKGCPRIIERNCDRVLRYRSGLLPVVQYLLKTRMEHG